jgi:hypothetical protein
MKKIRMKQDAIGAPDHINIQEYKKGKTYEVPDSLGKVLIDGDLATELKPKKKAGPSKTKVTGPSENKEKK